MKKLIILTIVGLLLGLAGAVGIVVVREKQARAAAVTLAADSAGLHADSAVAGAAHDSAAVDSTAHLAHGDSAAIDSLATAAPATDSAAPAAAPGTAARTPVSRPDSLRAEVIAASGPAGPDEQRLARIFAAMRPEEAARVLEQMTDPEIRLLLSHLRERQAAAIMSSIAPERAAVISSAVIRGERSSP